jgi:hypothetical protein
MVLHWMVDQFTGHNSSVEGLAHSNPAQRVFADSAAQLTDDLLNAVGDLCRHETVSPSGVFLERKATPYRNSALANPNFII